MAQNSEEAVAEAVETAETVAAEAEKTAAPSAAPVPNANGGVYIDKAEAEAFIAAQTKKKKRKRIIGTVIGSLVAVILIFVIYKIIFGGNVGYIKFSDDYITENTPKTAGAEIALTAEDQCLATVEKDGKKTELWFSAVDSLVTIKVTENGVTEEFRSWPLPTEDEADPATLSDKNPKYKTNHDIVSSLCRVMYVASNLDSGKDIAIKQVPAKDLTTKYVKIDNGFKAIYTIKVKVAKAVGGGDNENVEYKIGFAVEFSLDADGNLITNVPKKDLVEPQKEENYDAEAENMPRFGNVTVLPYMNAAHQGDKGYIVTPDGSGALTYFDEARIISYDEYKKRVYGYDDIFESFTYPNLNNENVSMPVYGIVKENKMMTVFATEGEANASIIIGQPGMRSVSLYYANFLQKWREQYTAKVSNGGDSYVFIEVPSGIGDLSQKYVFDVAEPEKKFTYVDVAVNTREFLLNKWQEDGKKLDYLEEGDLNKISDKRDPDLLNVKIFFNDVNQASVHLFSQFKVMTTFKDAERIITDASANNRSKIHFSLLGWQQDGYYGNITKKYGIENALGGKKDLKALNNTAANAKVDVAADVNMLLFFDKPKAGASLRSAVVKDPGTNYRHYKLLSNAGVYIKNDNYYYMSPLFYNEKMLDKDIKKLGKLGFDDVVLQQLGDLLYTDYNKENALMRQQALEYYRKWIVEYKKAFDKVSVYYGYEYAASVADMIFDIPTDSSKVYYVDEAIPFIQIVYHGIVDYYSAANNRTSNNAQAMLKSIEYGAFFTYEVTNENTDELRYTNYNSLFRAQYDSLSKEIKKAYVLASKVLAPVASAQITNHYSVDAEKNGSVFCTEYSNGAKIYVNYSAADYTSADGIVPATGVLAVIDGAANSYTIG